jgi:RHS repeat-associated protein
LILGGIGSNGQVVGTSELFDPVALKFTVLATTGLIPRAYHTSTVLTDGRLLIAGGISQGGETLGLIETWDFRTNTVVEFSNGLLVPRSRQTATLLADGTVLLWGGIDRNGAVQRFGEIVNPVTQSTTIATAQPAGSDQTLQLEASLPQDQDTSVPLDILIALRFSKPLSVVTLNTQTITLSGPQGPIPANVVPAENGMLAFVTPQSYLSEDTVFTVAVNGAADPSGNPLPETTISFTTIGPASPKTVVPNLSGSSDGDLWTPGTQNFQGSWKSGQGPSPWQKLPPLQAKPGVTALAGQALRLNGLPLEGVTLEINNEKAKTDSTGRFLLANITSGHQVLLIDGTTARQSGRTYGIFEVGVDVASGETTALNYTIWMTRLDMEHATTIPSPTSGPTVISTPLLPGLELHLPANTVIRDHNGKVVRQVSITPIPVDQPPFPLPKGVKVPIYFTIQPGDAYIDTAAGAWTKGAQLYYPNSHNAAPGTLFDFWNYDAEQKGWYVYGTGTVSKDGKQIVPGAGVEIYEFTGAMVGTNGGAPPTGGTCGTSCTSGEPVDLSTGLFVYNKTDLVLPDTVPISVQRTYRTNDSYSRPFGIGASDSYEMFLSGDVSPYTYMELILPDGSRIYFYRTSSGTGYSNAVYAHTSLQSSWYGATVTYNASAYPGAVWDLRTRDGMHYYFPDSESLTDPAEQALIGIQDRNGNTVKITRDSNGNVLNVISPNSRYITFQHDSSNRITQAQDSAGRTVTYSYDSSGRLSTVTDANSGVTTYTYDSNDNMLTVEDARGITYLTNQYDTNGRVTKQILADGSTYQFSWTTTSTSSLTYGTSFGSSSYTSPGGSSSIITGFRACSSCSEGYASMISKVDITDPNGVVREVTFGSTGQMATDTYTLGDTEQQAFTYSYYADNLVQSVTDQLGRETDYSYDANGNVTEITRLAGTSNAVSTSYTYDTTFSQLTGITDPLSHSTSFGLDSNGNTTSVTDALSHETTIAYDAQGRSTSVTDPLSHATSFAYDTTDDLISVTDPLSRTISKGYDAAGRVTSVTDPLGETTKYAYDALNDLTSKTDALNGKTSLSYDGNGNLTGVTDANGNSTSYAYDNMDRLETRTDPLSRSESYVYDGNGNLTQFTDRRGKVTAYTYDHLNRRTFAGFNMLTGPTYDSTITNTYDGGDRLTQSVDSVTGTITRTYDGLDRMTEETTPQGSVSYAYDSAGRRTSMTVGSVTAVSYTYDNANRLTQIARGTPTVSLSYDNANRRTSLTLPNGVTVSYSYDNGSQLTGLTYTLSSTTLGTLTYGYDLAGRRTSIGGSYATTGVPNAISVTGYDAANELTQWGTATPTYDSNGNTTSDGTNSYVWNARNQLASMNSSAESFAYDPFGRRTGKTIIGTTTNYLYDGTNPVQELSGTTPTANLLTGLGVDEYFTRTDSSTTANFLTDALGSPVLLADGSGSTLAQYSYEPFGNTAVTSGSSANAYQYTGRENDGTGVYFYRARYYSPTLQRFISEDPDRIKSQDLNFYRYAYDNPIGFCDPSGRDPLIGAGVGIVVGGIYGGIGALMEGGATTSSVLAGIGVGALIGGTIGAADPTLGIVSSTIVGAAASAAGDAIAQGMDTGSINGGNVAGAALGGAIGGAAAGVVGAAATVAGVSEGQQAVIGGMISSNIGTPAAGIMQSIIRNIWPPSTSGRKDKN